MNEEELNNITVPRMSSEDRDKLINEHRKQNKRLVDMWRNPTGPWGPVLEEELDDE